MSKKILIVDDSPTERHVLEQIVVSAGYSVVFATNGKEGVEKSRIELPDLILMDVVMPDMNGYQATREITKTKETSHIPVIMCTTRQAATDKTWGMRQGAQEYLVKPITKEKLIPKIKELIK